MAMRAEPRYTIVERMGAGALIAKFVFFCGKLGTNLAI
jgi:hypothetical protein